MIYKQLKYRLVICILFSCAFSGSVFSQNTVLLVDSARSIALQNNNTIKAAAYNVNVATSKMMEAKGGHMPSINLNAG
ncbi:MAG TPA: hypothetical protein VFM99_06690, partial [Chitinophagales bacterium]|nr:hypothetical protein [Chitinophagales bacterium]